MGETAMGRKKRGKMKWSKLYSFSCLRPSLTDENEGSSHRFLGQLGFTRMVFCNDSELHKIKPYKYPNNYISTTKYNIATFLPKALFEQFRRVANLYFLLAAALSVTSLTPFSPVSLIFPLVFVVGISVIKEAVEDWHRFLEDMKVNSRTVKAHVGNGVFNDKQWRSLLVGDVVKINKNEYFPSDLLLLSSSYEDGMCYVETMNLDGETNLKAKRCLESTLVLGDDAEFSHFKAKIRCEDPNSSLYTFVGNLDFEKHSYPLSPAQLLLRDSKLRNTDYVYGVVVFTGPDTKVVRNSTNSPSKRSKIEKKMDRVIYLLFSMLVLISLISAFGSAMNLYTDNTWYLPLPKEPSFFNSPEPLVSGFVQFIRSLILYGYLIPISLYVSIEVVKILQAMLINKDIELYDDLTCKSVEARTSNLNEELGQVEIILSDKTGTLTCNQMEFRKCSIAGTSYGGDHTEIDIAASKRMNVDNVETYKFSYDEPDSQRKSFDMHEFSVDDIGTQKALLGARVSNETPSAGKEVNNIKGFKFKDKRLLNKQWMHTTNHNLFDTTMFFRVMALCHTGIPVDQEDETGRLKYEAESPEEVGFLIASQEFGFKFCRRTQSTMLLKELDPSSGKEVDREYKLLNLLEFSSSRKRMSVIVRDENGQIMLLCKGADSVIFEKLGDGGQTYIDATTLHLSKYAEDGFRTLAFAYRLVEAEEYEKWNAVFTEAKATIGPERDQLLECASEMIEKDLILLGAVAVEDKLQKGVPECIDKLAQAGLKIWLLTGDKKETATNIGFACSLLRNDMKQFNLSLSNGVESSSQAKDMMIKDIVDQIERCSKVIDGQENLDRPYALVVDGKALEVALRNDVKNQFLKLAINCASVICCRVSPKQKALIARLVKQYSGRTTLAIGDGANDVGMIQEADIGVGISGMEGMQAVMASDFSMPQFRFLERLLIVHGHWCYTRIAKMILYFVYKNITFGLTLFYYEIYTNFTGEVMYDDWYMVLFNVLLTSLPVISLGVLEQDVSSDVCLQFPALYQQGQKNIYFSWARIIGWIFNGLLASLSIFIINVYALSPSAFREDGTIADLPHFGAIIYTSIIWAVNSQIALIINHFTWIQHFFIWGSILSWYIFLYLYGALPAAYSNKGFRVLVEAIGTAPVYWTVTLLAVTVSLLPYFIHMVIERRFYPMDDHVIQEMKYCRKDIAAEDPMWLREQKNSRTATHIGLSSRVDAKIWSLREQIHQKRVSIYRSLANSPIFRSLTSSPSVVVV